MARGCSIEYCELCETDEAEYLVTFVSYLDPGTTSTFETCAECVPVADPFVTVTPLRATQHTKPLGQLALAF